MAGSSAKFRRSRGHARDPDDAASEGVEVSRIGGSTCPRDCLVARAGDAPLWLFTGKSPQREPAKRLCRVGGLCSSIRNTIYR